MIITALRNAGFKVDGVVFHSLGDWLIRKARVPAAVSKYFSDPELRGGLRDVNFAIDLFNKGEEAAGRDKRIARIELAVIEDVDDAGDGDVDGDDDVEVDDGAEAEESAHTSEKFKVGDEIRVEELQRVMQDLTQGNGANLDGIMKTFAGLSEIVDEVGEI